MQSDAHDATLRLGSQEDEVCTILRLDVLLNLFTSFFEISFHSRESGTSVEWK